MRVWAYVEGERRESGGEEATEAEEAEVPDAVLSGDQDAGQRSGGRWLFPRSVSEDGGWPTKADGSSCG